MCVKILWLRFAYIYILPKVKKNCNNDNKNNPLSEEMGVGESIDGTREAKC